MRFNLVTKNIKFLRHLRLRAHKNDPAVSVVDRLGLWLWNNSSFGTDLLLNYHA